MRGLMDLEGIKGETLHAAAPRCPSTRRGCDVVLDCDFYVVSLTGSASPAVALSKRSLINASLSVTNGTTDGVLTVDDLGDTTAVTARRVFLTAPSLVLHTASLRIAGAESVCGAFTVENGNNEISVATKSHAFPSHVVCAARCAASPAFFGLPSDPSRSLCPCSNASLTNTIDLPDDAPTTSTSPRSPKRRLSSSAAAPSGR